jgi:alkanesulfonate monooxygenase SsuD/methylene tetrahydromethanopterin reductase-like flavin-dependent oxidoreductase (luciferase family)
MNQMDRIQIVVGPMVRYATDPIRSRIGPRLAIKCERVIRPASLPQFASLDHLSRGRAGWNIVTTSAANTAQNFDLPPHPVHADRYDRARKYLDVVTRLWDSWEDDALVIDKASGIFADTDRIHAIEHIGHHFKVAGPLNTPRTPQDVGSMFSRRVGRRARLCRTLWRSDLHRASDLGQRAGVLWRHQASGGWVWQRSGPHQDPARHQSIHRRH